MLEYSIYIIALLLIIMFWILIAKISYAILKRKGYKITKREVYSLLFLCFVMLAALIFTFIRTNGTFIW